MTTSAAAALSVRHHEVELSTELADKFKDQFFERQKLSSGRVLKLLVVQKRVIQKICRVLGKSLGERKEKSVACTIAFTLGDTPTIEIDVHVEKGDHVTTEGMQQQITEWKHRICTALKWPIHHDNYFRMKWSFYSPVRLE